MDIQNQGIEAANRILRYFEGSIQGEELERFEQWLEEDVANRQLFEQLQNAETLQSQLNFMNALDTDAAWNKVNRQIGTPNKVVSIGKRLLPYAAALLLLAGGAVVLYYNNLENRQAPVAKKALIPKVSQSLPTEDKTRLKLADGSVIVLDDTPEGTVRELGNVRVTKKSGELVYEVLPAAAEEEVVYHTLSTSAGRQIRVVLPDGSRVWLNAASSLHFPTVFRGEERKVELKGEGYFEVERRPEMPFLVETGNSSVEVLGTHFNVRAYTSEDAVRTTLLEGAVKVQKGGVSKVLKPGYAASVKDENIRVASVDVEEAVAWKNGRFHFRETDLQTIMQEMERWYDVEVHYSGNVKGERFSGTIPRTATVAQVLEMLELTRTVKFIVEGKNITVRPF